MTAPYSSLNLDQAASGPAAGLAGIAALGCFLVAISVALIDANSGALRDLALAPSLIAVGMAALAFGLREMSVRDQFANQAWRNTRAQRALEEKMHWLQTTEAHAQIGHWRLDLESNDVFWSDTTYAIHGLEPNTPLSLEDALNFYHEDDRAIVVQSIERARLSGEFEAFKARLINAQGALRYVEAGASVEFAADGAPAALFGIFKDRTGEEEMQLELRQASEDAHTLARAKGLFLARMSHEIRTPMNGLLGFAELLADSELSPAQQSHADYIVESGHSLQALLKDILDFTKAEAGKIEFDPQRISVKELFANVTQSVSPQSQKKGIRLIEDIAADAPGTFIADGPRLRQILGNLLSNAVRFTDSGTVCLSVRKVDRALHFAVSDTGIGIAPSMIKRIFDPFMHDADHAKTQNVGTGLGLAVSRNLAQAMGGTLDARSHPGEGSVFTLVLPLTQPSSAAPFVAPEASPVIDAAPTPKAKTAKNTAPEPAFAPRPQPEPASPRASSPAQVTRVLLAEDYDINRELVIQIMQRLGIALDCAEDGLEAISMVHQARAMGRPYSLVLMDLQMPRLDGYAATRRLRASGIAAKDLPIIAVTANAFQDDIDNCFAAGMQEHLAKPLSMDTMSRMLEQWLPSGLPDSLPETDSAEDSQAA